jgi:signal transduction histidine kinase
VRELMRGTSVFKIKVYDLRGLTVYSSDPEMVGEDKSDNDGWRKASSGQSASELIHRNQMSVFEQVVKDRDLIQSYVPVFASGGRVVGVFEIYSDVTPLLQQLEVASARGAATIARNQARMKQGAANNVKAVQKSSDHFLMTIYAMLVLTYVALLFFVRRGQQFIDREARAREQAALREQEWHRDKMATMGAMAANISHNVGNPLAIISGLAEEISHACDTGAPVKPEYPSMIVEQTARIAGMTRRISHFASAGRNAPEIVDINQQVKAICDFLRFDRRFHGSPIQLKLGDSLPACEVIPDHLTEALMGLLQALEQACEKSEAPNRLLVETLSRGGEVVVRVAAECDGKATEFPMGDPRVESARRRMEGMKARIEPAEGGVEMRLPAASLDQGG